MGLRDVWMTGSSPPFASWEEGKCHASQVQLIASKWMVKDMEPGPSKGCNGRKSIERLTSEAIVAYQEGTSEETCKLLDVWEEVKQESEMDK